VAQIVTAARRDLCNLARTDLLMNSDHITKTGHPDLLY